MGEHGLSKSGGAMRFLGLSWDSQNREKAKP